MVLVYVPTYRLSQEKLKSHLEDVFGYTIIVFDVSDAYHSHTGTASLVSWPYVTGARWLLCGRCASKPHRRTCIWNTGWKGRNQIYLMLYRSNGILSIIFELAGGEWLVHVLLLYFCGSTNAELLSCPRAHVTSSARSKDIFDPDPVNWCKFV